jgi:4-hydroxybenzoate polyprenyltransferase
MALSPAAVAGRALVAVRVIHPFPTLANVVATALFALVAARGLPDGGRLARLLLAMFCIQSAIGAANDAVDVELDRAAKPYKPIVAGGLRRRDAWLVAGAAAALACLIALTLGPGGWALAMAGLACGLAYDLGLKRTAWSVVTYIVALPLLPLWVWTALGHFSPALLWAYPLGALLGVSLYLGNTAPDVAADARAGVYGAAHRLGERGAVLGSRLALAAAALCGLALAPLAGYRTGLVAGGAGAALLALGVAIAISRRGDTRGLQRAWALLIAGSLAFGVAWLAAAPA